MTGARYYRCDCGAITAEADVLRAPHPFDPGEKVYGCPACLGLAGDVRLLVVCDEPGCIRVVTCGTPNPGGYRSTCSEHRPAPA